jgi:hypothetical protein
MFLRRSHLVLGSCAGALLLNLSIFACSSPRAEPPARPVATPVASHVPELWGDLKPVVSVKELMRDMIDPASDFVFDAIGTVIGKKGVKEIRPHTDADWDRIRVGAVTMAEGVYLLKIPRPFAPPGDENNSTGADSFELSPAQIKAKLEKDPVLWNAKIEALRNVGLEVMDIVKRRDVDELWDAAENLDQACEQCHLEYWYPSQKELLTKLDAQLEELYGTRTGTTAKTGMDPGRPQAPAPRKPKP